jgi:hypothetical protein
MTMGYVLVNLSHPFTDDQLAELMVLVGSRPERCVDVRVQFDDAVDYTNQATALVYAITEAGVRLGTDQIVLNPPAHSAIASIVLAMLHGRSGGFPAILRMKRAAGPLGGWAVAEVVNLQAVREQARTGRGAS